MEDCMRKKSKAKQNQSRFTFYFLSVGDVQPLSGIFCFFPFSHVPEVHHLMVTATKVALILHILSKFFLVSMSLAECFPLPDLPLPELQICHNELQKPPALLVPCYAVLSANIRVGKFQESSLTKTRLWECEVSSKWERSHLLFSNHRKKGHTRWAEGPNTIMLTFNPNLQTLNWHIVHL